MITPRAGWPAEGTAGQPVWTDPSFANLLRLHPVLEGMRRNLPASFDGQDGINALQSSYFQHGYGSFVYALVRAVEPRQGVEIGLFQGFSLLNAAAALRDNGAGSIAGYDLFGDYPYRHAEWPQISAQVLDSGLETWTTVHQADLGQVHNLWEAVDYLHVDVSNDGDTFRQVFEQWAHKVRRVILLEGGSRERDNVDWMLEYCKPAIEPALADIRRAHPDWSISVLEPFPSMTIALRRQPLTDHTP